VSALRPLPQLFTWLVALLFSSALTAAEQPHLGKSTLVPIKDTLTQITLDGLAGVPVQHGGRYKPLFSMGMEVSDAIAYSTTLGNGHTPPARSGVLPLGLQRPADRTRQTH